MAVLSNALVAIGLVFLTHAVYSAHEHSALHSTTTAPSPSSSSSSIPSLPADIVAETLLSVLLVAAGIVLSSAPLKPIEWSRWAGEAEREEARRRVGKGRRVDVAQGEVPGGNPFAWITEDRVGFWDGRGKRQDFANWVREGGRS
ncbi:transmembrane protein 32 protein [Diplodia corticola]|uniref:Transmembrane protein 32 protein n=1 Tax=Diplodia corticola TaxID=236234 RepID=A0A1J9RE42_9PEZI|nr:transmembrane protein 32 protein [Diplodia corticola]OJD38808.1 transmembrane protein 32 protein [Diplodia corticola]